MISRWNPISCSTFSLFLLLLATVATADDHTFDCHVNVDNAKFDLTQLGVEHTPSRTRQSPPAEIKELLKFNLCHELKHQDDVPKDDQCGSRTRACLTKSSQRLGKEDQLFAVIPLAEEAQLPTATTLYDPEGLELVFRGGKYPHPGIPGEHQQYLNVTLLCSQDAHEPEFKTYNGTHAGVEWRSPLACYKKDGEHKPGDGDHHDEDKDKDHHDEHDDHDEDVGSGIGWFFLMILLAFVAYFGLGAYYNYTTYGATGMDLIPHRDFWKEVPYMLKDVVSHLCSSVRPRRQARNGYISV